jgi:hypothetical protein
VLVYIVNGASHMSFMLKLRSFLLLIGYLFFDITTTTTKQLFKVIALKTSRVADTLRCFRVMWYEGRLAYLELLRKGNDGVCLGVGLVHYQLIN